MPKSRTVCTCVRATKCVVRGVCARFGVSMCAVHVLTNVTDLCGYDAPSVLVTQCAVGAGSEAFLPERANYPGVLQGQSNTNEIIVPPFQNGAKPWS